MFIDYYLILGVNSNVTKEEIKTAFKKQALIWHPDKNIGIDTTSKMQEINEAKLILLDNEARLRYDIEYQAYKEKIEFKKGKNEPESNSTKEENPYNEEYNIHDEELNRWISNAREQSIELAKQTIADLKGMVKSGTKAAVKEGFNAFIAQIIISIIALLFIAFSRGCN